MGILRYFGEIELTSGLFCGVELDEPVGLNDGSVQGVRYFTCRPQHGIIAPVSIVRPLPGGICQEAADACPARTNGTFIVGESGPYSLLEGLETPSGSAVQQSGDDGDHFQMQVSTAVKRSFPSHFSFHFDRKVVTTTLHKSINIF